MPLTDIANMFLDWTLTGLMVLICAAVWMATLWGLGFAALWTIATVRHVIQCVTGVRDKEVAQKNEGYDGW